MNHYLLDTNCLLRFILNDHENQVVRIKALFKEAKNGESTIYIPLGCVTEAIYVFLKLYKFSKQETIRAVIQVFELSFLTVEKYDILLQALLYFRDYPISIVDALCFVESKERGETLFTFDENLKKLLKRSS